MYSSELGINFFGENKVQEAEKKLSSFNQKTEIHMIGHLQSNKIKKMYHVVFGWKASQGCLRNMLEK